MRIFLCAMTLVASALAQANNVQCNDASRSNALIYNPEKLTISFILLNGTAIGVPREIAISGEIASRDGLTQDFSIFNYPLANGQSVDLTWQNSETETNPGLRGNPYTAMVKDSGGLIVGTYPNCVWSDRL